MRTRVYLVAILSLAATGCAPARRKLVLPAAQPAVAKPLPQAKIETPPEIETSVPVVELTMPEVAPPHPEPPAPKPAPTRRAAVPPQSTPPEISTPIPVVPTTPAPRLGEILTDDRRRQYESDFNGYVTRARAVVSWAQGRRGLNKTQQEYLGRIRVFLQQAETARAKDLATALQLARRADLLGQDLLKSLK